MVDKSRLERKRRFGEVAVGLHYISADSIKRYIDHLEMQRDG